MRYIKYFYRKLYKNRKSNLVDNSWWKGNYQNWVEAENCSIGYDSDVILEKCSTALLAVKNKEFKYERDSVLFDSIQYSRGLLIGLLKVALVEGRLSVLDFGGSLGSSYFQNREFLEIEDIEWSIVEQTNFVKRGKSMFEDNCLKFYTTIEECLPFRTPNILLLSSVLQYMDEPQQIIRTICELNFEYIVIDRTALIEDHPNIITVQNTPTEIYEATYPCWFFNENWLLNSFPNYSVHLDWNSEFELRELFINGDQKVYWKGFFLRRKLISI